MSKNNKRDKRRHKREVLSKAIATGTRHHKRLEDALRPPPVSYHPDLANAQTLYRDERLAAAVDDVLTNLQRAPVFIEPMGGWGKPSEPIASTKENIVPETLRPELERLIEEGKSEPVASTKPNIQQLPESMRVNEHVMVKPSFEALEAMIRKGGHV